MRHTSLDTARESNNPILGELMVACKYPMHKVDEIQYVPLYALGWI